MRVGDILRYSVLPGAVALMLLGVSGCAAAPRAQPADTAANAPLAPAQEPQLALASAALAPEFSNPPDAPAAPSGASAPRPQAVPPAARAAVQAAFEAKEKKRWAELRRLLPQSAADPELGRYPRYWDLRQRLLERSSPVPEADTQKFLDDFPDGYTANRIRADLLVARVRSGDFAGALQIPAIVDPTAAVQCAQLLAQHQMGKRVHADKLMASFKPNSDCWDLLDQAAADHVLSRAELQAMLRNILEEGNKSQADRMAAVAFDAAAMVRWAAIKQDAKKWLQANPKPRSTTDFELTALALARLARSDDRAGAAEYIQQNWASKIAKADLQWVWGQFGLVAALNVAADAPRWYRQSGYVAMTDFNHAWEVRSELRAHPLQWDKVANAIRKMTARQMDEPVWRYWYARALAASGNTEAAEQYYLGLAAQDQGFYGLLATEELGQKPQLPPQPSALPDAPLAAARANPALLRAAAMFDLGWRADAVPEWNFALRGMSDEQLRAAAEFARERQIFDRVVNTSLLTAKEFDYSQRFIAPFAEQVSARARQIDLDPAWVYGLIRQESRFIMDARSRVGASGLMQLMPATARWVAKKIGMKDFRPENVNDFDTNTILGTSYMDIVLKDLGGSQLLATAGYNAGPGRPKRWRTQLATQVEGAIFAETIPFTETRLYVKNVLSNAVYYSMLFNGESDSLKQRLGTVAP